MPTMTQPGPKPDLGSLELTEEIIRLRAYQIFEARGCQHGHDSEDWLQAEAEIMGKRRNSSEQESAAKEYVASAAA